MISGGNNETRTFRILSHTGDKFYRGDCKVLSAFPVLCDVLSAFPVLCDVLSAFPVLCDVLSASTKHYKVLYQPSSVLCDVLSASNVLYEVLSASTEHYTVTAIKLVASMRKCAICFLFVKSIPKPTFNVIFAYFTH